MISKEKAAVAAEELLAIERGRLAEIQNTSAPKVPVWLWVDGLSSLEPRHRAALLREAERVVQGGMAFQAWAVAWVASIAIAWYFSSSGQPTLRPLLAFAPAIGVLGLRRWFVRRELKRLVASPSCGHALTSGV